MKKTYEFKNLGCAHCAGKMEEKIGKLPDVESVNLSFPMKKMYVETSREDLLPEIQKICTDIEPDVIVTEVIKKSSKRRRHVEEDSHESHEHHHHHDDEVEMDEHVWLSLKNAKLVCNTICENLKKLSPKYADKFDENLKAYVEKLDALDKKYSEELTNQKFDTVLFGDRFPFRYLVDDYNLKYYAAFVGCSQESEASFETIVFLANKVDELGLKSIFTLSDSDHKIAETVKENTKDKTQEIRILNSLESVTSNDNTSYLEVMEENLESLKAGLN